MFDRIELFPSLFLISFMKFQSFLKQVFQLTQYVKEALGLNIRLEICRKNQNFSTFKKIIEKKKKMYRNWKNWKFVVMKLFIKFSKTSYLLLAYY